MELLCGQHWKTLTKIESELMSEDAASARTGAIGLLSPVLENVLHKV